MSYKDRWGQYYKGAGDTFPVGIGSIAGYAIKQGLGVDVVEPDIMGWTAADLEVRLRERNYDLIGISAFTTTIHHAYATARLIRNVLPECAIVIGGAHPTLFPEQTLAECPEIDYCVVREGEKPFVALAKALQGEGSLAETPNLYYRQDGGVVKSRVEIPFIDLDELDLFPYRLFDMDRYVPAPSLRKVLPTFNYMAQRGCPYSCAFCDTRTHGKKVRYRSVPRVLDDLETLKDTYGLKGLIFEGSNFTADWHWVKALAQGMIERQLDLSWYCMGRVDFNLELLPLLKQSGLWAMSFGIESANDETLKRMRKHITAGQARETLRVVRRHGIRAIGSFILGYPGETEADVLRTIQHACDLDLDVAVFFIPVPFPGTGLMEDARRFGGLAPEIRWEDYVAWLDHNHPIYVNPNLGDRHVQLYNLAYRKFYLRPGYILRQLQSVTSLEGFSRLLQGFRSVASLAWKGLIGQGRAS